VVLVTGAGHGIGRAVAERFASEGARVVVNDLDETRASEVAAVLDGAIAIAADVAVKAQVDGMFDRVESELGPVDVLVNNAGNIHAARHFLRVTRRVGPVVGVNLKAPSCARSARRNPWRGATRCDSICRAAAPPGRTAATLPTTRPGGIMTAMALDLRHTGARQRHRA
jgi:NAD(P)-dependent dehydrogenase (short-subunit alcohol dehydrogenase family)